jgi:hypothetical protein
MTTRRRFIILLPLASAASWAVAQAPAAAPLDPKDPQAVALGYTPDATQVDKAKHSTYVAGQACGNCALYQGAANSASGPCPIYAGKLVSSKAWCSAYVKKA